MGKQTNGILAPFTGKVGPITGRIHNKTGVIQSNADYSNRIWSPAQIANRQKLKDNASFLSTFYDYVYFDHPWLYWPHDIKKSLFISKNLFNVNNGLIINPKDFEFSFCDLPTYKMISYENNQDNWIRTWINSIPKEHYPNFPYRFINTLYYSHHYNLFYKYPQDLVLYTTPLFLNPMGYQVSNTLYDCWFWIYDHPSKKTMSKTYHVQFTWHWFFD